MISKKTVFASALLSAVSAERLQQSASDYDLNEQPVIGIVAQGIDSDFSGDPRFDGYDSYIMAAYVKFVEAAGARVVPILYNEPTSVTLDKLSKLDGVLFPGGANSYVSKARTIMSELTKYNDEGHFYPAWGTCLGY